MLDHVTKLLQGAQDALAGHGARPSGFRVLVALAGGPHAMSILDTLPGLASPGYEIHLVHVRAPGAPSGTPVLEAALERLHGASMLARGREIVSQDVRAALTGASRDADLLVLGASLGPRPIGNSLAVDLAKRSACPVVVVRAGFATYVPRSERKALVVGDASHSGRLGLNRALRWGLAGCGALDILLGASDDPFSQLEQAPSPLEPDPAYNSVREVGEALQSTHILAELETGQHDLLVLAVDPARLEGSRRWVDELVRQTQRPVLCAFAGRKGPRTRTRAPSVAMA